MRIWTGSFFGIKSDVLQFICAVPEFRHCCGTIVPIFDIDDLMFVDRPVRHLLTHSYTKLLFSYVIVQSG